MRFPFLLLLLCACARETAVVVPPNTAAPVSSNSYDARFADELRCTKPLATKCATKGPDRFGRLHRYPSLLSGGVAQSVQAGQMTEEAAQAKRLFDGEKWADAMNALERVASGETGDDLGNRELAEYHLAIAFERMQDYEPAADLFSAIARVHTHLKFREASLWLMRLLSNGCTREDVVGALTSYIDLPATTPEQAALSKQFYLARGRGFLLKGQRSQANADFERLVGEPDFADAARECMR